jgi:hypothetical protein
MTWLLIRQLWPLAQWLGLPLAVTAQHAKGLCPICQCWQILADFTTSQLQSIDISRAITQWWSANACQRIRCQVVAKSAGSEDPILLEKGCPIICLGLNYCSKGSSQPLSRDIVPLNLPCLLFFVTSGLWFFTAKPANWGSEQGLIYILVGKKEGGGGIKIKSAQIISPHPYTLPPPLPPFDQFLIYFKKNVT